jgi:hypothetical protein
VKARSISTLIMPLGLTATPAMRVPGHVAISVAPNPAASAATLRISGVQPGTVVGIVVTDMLGRAVITTSCRVSSGGLPLDLHALPLDLHALPLDLHALPLDLHALPRGAYRISAIGRNGAASTMLHVLR